MKHAPITFYWLLVPVILIVLIDSWLKSFALAHLPDETFLTQPTFLDFAVHKNYGLAFDLPFRMEIAIFISLIIGFFLFKTAWQTKTQQPLIAFACLMILLGAAGNFFDRLFYGFTVDYVFLLGRSAINFADLVIVLGVIALLLFSSKKKRLDISDVH